MKRYEIDGYDWNQEESADGEWVKYEDAQAAIQQAVLAERSACAKVADSHNTGDASREDLEARRIAQNIRARSK